MHRYFAYILSFLPSLIFCLRVLPLKQAIKVPIFIHKLKYFYSAGKISIACENIQFGMIKLGFHLVPLYRDTGVLIQNNGTLVFRGRCVIGSGSSLSIGDSGILILGTNFGASSDFRLVCNHKIEFGSNVLFGYECLVLDNDLHSLSDMYGNHTKAYGPICIGDNNWFGARCIILKNTKTPSFWTIAAGSYLTKSYLESGSYKVVGGHSKLKILKEGVYRDPNNDIIIYNNDNNNNNCDMECC
jgi:acetyltransferase-like isoleucine patch superfamily enzyme